MLTVRVTRKFHDKKGVLIGYTIKDMSTGQTMNVHKEVLKDRVAKGLVAVDNMTLTSDGRLIGHATEKDRPKTIMMKQKEPTGSGVVAECVFTNGKKIACVMVNKTELLKRSGQLPEVNQGLDIGISFDVGSEATELIQKNYYENIKYTNSKADFSNTKKKSYTKLKDKLIKILAENDVHTQLSVTKGENKYEYIVKIDNYTPIENRDTMKQIIYILVENAIIENHDRFLYIDEDSIVVSSLSGIEEIRKALRKAGIQKL